MTMTNKIQHNNYVEPFIERRVFGIYGYLNVIILAFIAIAICKYACFNKLNMVDISSQDTLKEVMDHNIGLSQVIEELRLQATSMKLGQTKASLEIESLKDLCLKMHASVTRLNEDLLNEISANKLFKNDVFDKIEKILRKIDKYALVGDKDISWIRSKLVDVGDFLETNFFIVQPKSKN